MPAMYKPRVLVVDDELGVRESLRLILKDRAEVTLAVSGEEALVLVTKDRPEVILLDILMPGCDGLEDTPNLMHLKERRPGQEIADKAHPR